MNSSPLVAAGLAIGVALGVAAPAAPAEGAQEKIPKAPSLGVSSEVPS